MTGSLSRFLGALVATVLLTVVLSACGGGGEGPVTGDGMMPGDGDGDGGTSATLANAPSNHGLSPRDEITIQPGSSEEHGNVEFSCPAGGLACVVSVAADGTVRYDRTGGMPSIVAASESLALPWVHGLSEGTITVQPGASEEHGNVTLSCPAGGEACVMTVATDGMVTYARTGGMPTFALLAPQEYPELPVQQPVHAVQAPIIDLDGTLHIGADVAPPASQLTAGSDYNGIAVSSGRVQDGVGADRVFEYLQEFMSLGEYKETVGLEGYSAPPVVRIAEGTGEEFTEYVVRAIQLVNAALPYDKRVVLSTIPAPPLAAIDDVPDGQIFIDFVPWTDWNASNKTPIDTAVAIAQSKPIYYYNYDKMRWEIQGTRASHIWVDTNHILRALVFNSVTGQWEVQVLDSHEDDTDSIIMTRSEDANTGTLAHELLHTLGFSGHVDPTRFMNSSILNVEDFQERSVHTSNGTATLNEHNMVPGHLLFPVDREALLATYDRLEPGILPEEFSLQSLGPWDDTSFHLLGEMSFPGGDASFGVALRNGFAQPWASGPTPWIDLADNPRLPESATWNGALLGITPSEETVAGNARLNVDLVDLDGQLDFTSMEQWGTYVAPAAPGSGATWGDGDLGYGIEVRGNTFLQTGGDDGEVTGAFFGATHEAMGGVLERDDLSAGFGGTR